MSATKVLSEEERMHFLKHGWIKIEGAFTKEQAEEATQDVWKRLGMSPTDKGTWNQMRINMPASHLQLDAAQFAPRAWAAVCELCGGEDRIDPACRKWRDTFIVNLGTPENEGKEVVAKELDNYHVDGDFFVHYLDSPEQGLLIIPLYTDVVPGGGGTYICPEAMPRLAQWLYDHPEGVSPRMVPRGHADFGKEKNLNWFLELARTCDNFIEVTGKAGDVFLLHPLMLHSASTNPLRRVRIITNPPVSLKEPFRFARANGQYSLVELTTMRALGREPPLDWEIKAPRETIIPERVRRWEKMKAEEANRMGEVKGT